MTSVENCSPSACQSFELLRAFKRCVESSVEEDKYRCSETSYSPLILFVCCAPYCALEGVSTCSS